MGRLSGCVNDDIRSYLFDCLSHRVAIAYVDLMVIKASNAFFEPLLVPARVPLGTEKYRPLIIVYSMDFESSVREVDADLGSNQTIGTGYQDFFTHLDFTHSSVKYFFRGLANRTVKMKLNGSWNHRNVFIKDPRSIRCSIMENYRFKSSPNWSEC